MKVLRRYRISNILYILAIIVLLACGNYRKIADDYEEDTGIQYWVRINNQDRIEQQINLIQFPGEIMEQKVRIFYKAENIGIGDSIEIECGGIFEENGTEYDIALENGIQQVDIRLPDNLETGQFMLVLNVHTDSQAKFEIGMAQNKLNLCNAIINETEQEAHLAMRTSYYVFELEKGKIIYRNIAVAILIIMTLSAFACLYNGRLKYGVFASAFVITFVYIVLSYFELCLHAVPFIEDAVLFGESAKYESFLTQCLIKDEGYLCILQHLIAWFCVRMLGLGHQAYLVMNLIAVLFVSLMNSIINLPIFESVADKKTRFFISICIPVLFARQYESYIFINFIYWGMILLLLTLFIDLDALGRKTYIGLVLLGVMICLSKGAYAILFPVACIYIFMSAIAQKYSKRNICFWLCIGLAGLGQILCYMMAGSEAVNNSAVSLRGILRMFMQVGRMVLGITPLLTPFSSEIVLGGLGALVCICGLVEFIKGIRTKETRYIVSTMLIAVGVCNSAMVEINVHYDKREIGLWYARQEFFSIVAYLLWAMVLISVIKKYKYIIDYGILLCGMLFCVRLSMKEYTNWIETPNTDNFSVARIDLMDWDLYGSYWEDDNYFIKIVPHYFSLSRNVFVDYFAAGNRSIYLYTNGENYTKSIISCNIIPDQSIEKIDIVDNSRLWGVYFLKNGVSCQYEVQAYDQAGNLLACGIQPDPCNQKGCIIKFDKPVENATYITFHDRIADRKINIMPEYAVVYME